VDSSSLSICKATVILWWILHGDVHLAFERGVERHVLRELAGALRLTRNVVFLPGWVANLCRCGFDMAVSSGQSIVRSVEGLHCAADEISGAVARLLPMLAFCGCSAGYVLLSLRTQGIENLL
jgi:hypothetical protein